MKEAENYFSYLPSLPLSYPFSCPFHFLSSFLSLASLLVKEIPSIGVT